MKYINHKRTFIINLYKNGESVKEICKRYSVAKSTLYSWLYKEQILINSEKKRNFILKNYFYLEQRCNRLDNEINMYDEILSKINLDRTQKLEIVAKLYKKHPTKTLCRLIKVDHSTFYNFIKRKVNFTQYEKHDNELKIKIKQFFYESDERFGANKIFQKLQNEKISCSLNKIVKLMDEMGLKSKRRNKPCKKKTSKVKYFCNKDLLRQCFNQEKPNIFWVGDVTEMKIGINRFYICAIMDLFSRKIIAYRLSGQNNNNLTINTFKQAFEERNCPENLTFHSDQGTNYTSLAYTSLLHSLKVRQSFSKKGTPYDNSVIESFFGNMKRDDLYSREYEYFEELSDAVKNYIEFYNDYRPHKSLGYKTPNQVEIEYYSSIH